MTKPYIKKLSYATFYYKDEASLINHREDGPAIEYSDGTKHWYVNGKRHRIGGPAFEYADGSKFWYLNGKRHRLDGPAVEYADGPKSWWLNGKNYSEEAHKRLVKMIAFL
jgi:uncharacterized Fe-S cluster-containing protein